ncbi:MAG: hypothetical protein CMM44_01275 [Rhodospirillaceae bacterium]|nr:hypothetical protein [Rhodospirillaceae bacterium]|tara:strand:+ start:1364 stop:1882 length:519 start_codon:yes stop_codon:yes gene_type:complete
MNYFFNLHDKITQAGYYLACLALASIFGAYIIEVFLRYFFNAPQWWASEAVSYSLCIGTFLMMPYVTWKKGHVAVAIIFEILPLVAVKPVIWLTYLLGFLTCALSAWFCFDESWRQWTNDVNIMAVKPVPKYLISIFIPFGFVSSTIHFMRFMNYNNIDIKSASTTGGFGNS